MLKECPFRIITLREWFQKKKSRKKGQGTRRKGEKTTHCTEVPNPRSVPKSMATLDLYNFGPEDPPHLVNFVQISKFQDS